MKSSWFLVLFYTLPLGQTYISLQLISGSGQSIVGGLVATFGADPCENSPSYVYCSRNSQKGRFGSFPPSNLVNLYTDQTSITTATNPTATEGFGNWSVYASSGGTHYATIRRARTISQVALFTTAKLSGISESSASGVQVVGEDRGFASQVKRVYDVRDYMTCDGVSNATSGMSAVLAAIGSTNVTIIVPLGQQCVLSTITFPSNVVLDFGAGGAIKVVTGKTVTILGNLIGAGRQHIFVNALANQGTISFAGSTAISVLYPEWFGAKKDGVTDDLAVLTVVAAVANTMGGATIDLGKGTYYLSGQWQLGTDNAQHHISVTGVSPFTTTINSNVSGSNAAIYLSQEKYVHLSNFYLHQAGTAKTATGIVLGGAHGSGTQSNGNLFTNVFIDSFGTCLSSADDGGVTSSEILLGEVTLQNCSTGFLSNNFNALNYVFTLLQISNDTIGVDMETAGITVLGGAAASNGTDFKFVNDGINTIIGFRSETAVAECISMSSSAGTNSLVLINYLCDGLSTPNTHTAIAYTAGTLTIESSRIGGQIVLATGTGRLAIRNSAIIDPKNTYTMGAQPVKMGPGFRIPVTSYQQFEVENNLTCNNTFNSCVVQWPSGNGYIYNVYADMNNIGQGAALAVTFNSIAPTAYVHHVGAGLIKNITVPRGSTVFLTSCIQLIPDDAFTTDTTGNIANSYTAAVGQTVNACYDPAAAKWYFGGAANLPLYEAGVFSSSERIYTNTQALTKGAATHTFAHSFRFVGSETFGCTCTDQTSANACKATPASATTVTLAGTGSDVLWLSCSGH
jgi:hypothetical protein